MRAPRRSDLALVAGAITLAGALVLLDDQGLPEWLFGSFMLSLLALLGRLGVDAWRSARAERVRAAHLGATQPAVVAQAAVARERARLAEEVEVCIRDSLRQVAAEIEGLDETRPVPGLQRVHALTRRTTSELRRQLGLLREPAGEEPVVEPGRPSSRHLVVGRRALAEGLVVAGIAAVESTAFLISQGLGELLPWSVVFTVLTAGTLAGRGSRPLMAIMACAGWIAAGSALGYPVSSGFWIVITLGVLMWTVAATPVAEVGNALARAATVTLLIGVLVWAFRRDDPENLGVLLVVVGVALTGGLLVARQRSVQARARTAVETRERVLDVAADNAVRAERVVVAHELHDVVSHAVGVIALQAAAAELSWPHDRAAVTRAVEVIRRTTTETLAELDRLTPSAADVEHNVDDLIALVERVRLAGTPVNLTVVGDSSAHADVVHRVVQESLTNAMRHAPGAPVTVRVHADARRMEVSVSNDGLGPGPSAGRGYGLIGLAERVEFAHGTFESGPGPHGRGFRVVATIPQTSNLSTT